MILLMGKNLTPILTFIVMLTFIPIVVEAQDTQKPLDEKTLKSLLKDKTFQAQPNQKQITNEKELSKKIKIYVNKLNSTSQITELEFGKNQLLKLGKRALPYLKDYLKNDKRTFVRVQIAFILGKMKDETAIPILEETAKSKYVALNKATIIAIGNIGGKNALNALKRLKKTTKKKMLTEVIKKSIKKAKKQ